jgi:hypothetical protein
VNIDYVEQSDDSPRKPAGLPADAYVEKRSQCHGGHFDLLIVPVQVELASTEDSMSDEIIDKVTAWVVDNQSDEEETIPPVTVPLYGCYVAWSRKRASIVGPSSRLDLLIKSVIDFSQCATRLIDLEGKCDALLKSLDGDAKHAFEFEENSSHRSQLANRFHESVVIRTGLAILTPTIHAPPVYPPTIASQLSERLRDRTRLADRHEFAVDRAEILGQFYEACGQRVTESGIARRQMGLEWAIVILLILQTAILVIDILSASGSS